MGRKRGTILLEIIMYTNLASVCKTETLINFFEVLCVCSVLTLGNLSAQKLWKVITYRFWHSGISGGKNRRKTIKEKGKGE